MLVETTLDFETWWWHAQSRSPRDPGTDLVIKLVNYELGFLNNLEGQPAIDTKDLLRVRRSKQYQLWRVSHPYIKGSAVRLIVWFPPRELGTGVLVVLGVNKAKMGDVFYDGVGARADGAITKWIKEKQEESD